MKCSETDILVVVVFFGELCKGIEKEITTTRIKLSSDEELDQKILLLFLGNSIFSMGGNFVIFIATILTAL